MKKADPATQLELIEKIDDFTTVTRLIYPSFVVDKPCDGIALRAGRITPDGIYLYFMRSVIHGKMPPSDDYVRLEILPTGYFLHPVEGGSKCLVSYCVQLNVSSLLKEMQENADIIQHCAPFLAKRVESILLNLGANVCVPTSERSRVSVK